MSAGFAAVSNLQLLRQDALLKNSCKCWVLWGRPRLRALTSWVLNPRCCRTGLGPSGKQTGWQARRWHLSRKPRRPRQARKRTVSQEQPFRAGANRRARHRPYPEQRKKARKASASSARQCWRGPGGGSPGELCPTVEESAGHLSGHQHCRGWGRHHFPSKTSAHPSVHQLPDQKRLARPPAGCGCLAVEGGHRAGYQRDIPRVLQLTVSGAEKDRRSSSSNRPIHSEPPHGSSTLQDGITRIRPISHQKSRVDSLHRHPRRVSPCPDAPSRTELSAICGQQESLPIHSSTLRIGNITLRVHQAVTPGSSSVKAARCEAARLLRRLADPCRYSRTGSAACPDNHQCAPVSRLDHQLREVRPHSKSGLPVHRDAVQHSTVHSGAPTEDASQSPVCSTTLDDQPRHHSPRSAQIAGHADVYGFAGTTGKTPSSSWPVVGRHSMVPEHRELVRPDHSSSVGFVRGGLLGISSSPTRSSPRHQGNGSDSLHRCVQFGLGSPVRLTLDTGTVVSISKVVAHQRSGDAGRHQRCEGLPSSSEVPSGALMCDNAVTVAYIKNKGGTRLYTLMQMTIRYACSSGAISRRSLWFPSLCQESATSRQIPCPESVRHWARSGWWPWSVYDPCLPSGANHRSTCLRYSPTDDSSSLHRRIRTPGPSSRTPCQCPWTTGGASCMHFRHSRWSLKCCRRSLSRQVSWVDGSVTRRSHPAVRWGSAAANSRRITDRRDDRDSSLPAVKSTCVETLRAILMTKGHSREVAHMMSRALRDSSLQVYESHWARFVSFCRSKLWHVFRVRSHHFSTYMMHLNRDGLLPSTIILHRTSVASVPRHWVYDPAADRHIKLLIRAFRLEHLVQRRIMPKWDLHLVLLALMRLPFTSECDAQGESSDDVIPLKWRTMKTGFLLALASSRWGSYIHALSQWLFVHWNRNIRDIMRSHISQWIVETVKEAYTQADREYDWVTAHEVRALSASWVYNCQVALPDILSAAFWRSSGVFQNSYLRDMACIADGMSTLGPVVVAQHVGDPGHLHPPP